MSNFNPSPNMQVTGSTVAPKGALVAGEDSGGVQRNLKTSTDGTLQVAVSGAGSGGTSSTDGSTYTAGSSAGTGIMGVRDDTATTTLAEDKVGLIRVNLQIYLFQFDY